jgi:hypothetical protein
MTMQAPGTSVPAEISAPATPPEPAAPPANAAPEIPAEPLTPGEAAKAARVRAEEHHRLERVKRKSDELHRQRQAFEHEKKTHAESSSAAEKARQEEIAALRKELQELKTGNPLLRPGVDATAHLRELVAQGTPEAEVIALRKQLEKQASEFEEFKQGQTAASKAREEEEQRRVAEIQKGQEYNALQNITLWMTQGEQAKEFKYLNSEYSQNEIFQQAREVHEWGKANNKYWTGREVALYLESKAQKVHSDRETRRSAYLGAAPPSPAAPAAVIPGKVTPPAKGKPPVSANKYQTREQEIEADLAALRKASQADAIAHASKK